MNSNSGRNSEKSTKKKKSLNKQQTKVTTRSQTKKTKTSSGRFECDSCSKTFAWKKDLYRHEKYHEPNTKKFHCPHCDRRFIRKDKLSSHLLVHLPKSIQYFANNLFSEKKFQEIKCMLCNFSNASSVRELRQHISLHNNLELIKDLASSEVVKRFYSDKDLAEAMSLITSQIEAKQFAKFHSVVNGNSYEMGISDSDQSDPEGDAQYTCVVCQESFNRKHKLMQHQSYEHTFDECPHKCEGCQLRFTCKRVFESHLKHHCENAEKKFQCKKCPGRFTWLKNLENHKCGKAKGLDKKGSNCDVGDKVFNSSRDLRIHKKNHVPSDGGESHDCSICGEKNIENIRCHLEMHTKKDKLQLKKMSCMLCQKEFSNLKSLKQHLFSHSNGQADVDFKKCGFVKNFYPDADESTISECIRSCFIEQKLCQLYLAVNKFGDEMVLSDSESDDEQHSEESRSEPFICEVCGVKFSRVQAIRQHQNIEHDPEKTSFSHKCDECGDQFICEALLRRHTKSGCLNSNKTHSCSKCSAKFTWKENLEAHAKSHIPRGTIYNCSVCDEKFLRREYMRFHLKMHSKKDKVPLKKLLCMLCQKNFSSISSLKHHLFSHSDGKTDINFKGCGFVSSFYPDADEATISESIRSCFAEEKLWQLYLAVNKFGHETVLSDSDSDDEQQRSNEGPSQTYICELCDMKFPRMQTIRQHQHFEHDLVKSNFPHKCAKCGDQFVCEALLKRHTKSECLNSNRTNACSICETKFTWKQNLLAHVCSKGSKDDKKCEVCGKKFAWVKDLQRHKRSHIPEEKKFECLVCGKKFNRKDNMRQHMKVHQVDDEKKSKAVLKWKEQDENVCKPHGEKTIQCKICSTKYNSIRDLISHLVTHKERLKLGESEVRELSVRFYRRPLGLGAFSKAICRDITEGKHARFYSIANEMGYELNVLDSETGSELGTDVDDEDDVPKGYTCKLCNKSFNRKFKIFEHQRTDHSWDELPLECTHCSAKFVCESLYSWHLKYQCEDTEKQHKCKWCPLKFMWKDNLRIHEKYTHDKYPTKKRFHCKTCDKSFLWFKDLSRHKKNHRVEEEKFECTWCFRVFMRRDNLKVHMKVHQNANHLSLPDIYYLARPNGAKVAECKHCDQKYSTAHELLDHIQNSHLKYQMPITAPNPSSYSITNALGYEMDIDDSETEKEEPIEKYSCELCSAHFNRRFKLLKHQQAFHYSDTIPHKCTQCNFKSVSEYVLGYHTRTQCMNTVKQYRCSKCTMRFMWPENLANHESLIHDSPRTHSCGICKRDFATQHDLKNHPDCKPPTEVKLFECQFCDRKYNRKDRLMNHIKVHSSDEKKETRGKSTATLDKFLCAFCGKAVSSSSNLVIHLRRHTGEKPFKCEFCNKGFPRSSDLSCHRRTHTGERPYKCTTCDKAFSRSYKLQTHMRIHSGERPYKCTYCEKSFTQSNDLTLHVRRHTGERPYVCEICGERFIQGTALRNHRRMQGHYEM